MNDLNRVTSTSSMATRRHAADMESVILGGGVIPFDQMSLTSITSSAFSSVRSHSTLIESEGFVPRTKICLIGESVSPTLEAAAETFGLEVVTSLTGSEYLDDASVVLVVKDVESPAFENLVDIKWRVFGSMALIQLANDLLPLPIVKRPLFCFTMKGVVTCFTGIRDRNLIMELMFLIRSMGGSVRLEPNRHTTHLIAAVTTGPKYEYASTFLVPVMSTEWVWACWRMRDSPTVHANDEAMMVHRLGPFVGTKVAFVGFPKAEVDEAEKLLESNGGQLVDATSAECTHIVADDDSPVTIPAGVRPEAALVTASWFWSSIQQVMRCCEDEFAVPEERLRKPPKRGSVRRRSTGPKLSRNKENVEPDSASPSPNPYRQHRALRRVSLAELPSPNMYAEKTLTPCTPCNPWTPYNPDFPDIPDTPNIPDVFNDGTLLPASAPPAESLTGTCWSPRGGSLGSPILSQPCASVRPPRTAPPLTWSRPGQPGTPGTPRTPRTPGRRSLSSTDCTTPRSPRSAAARPLRRQSLAPLSRKGSLDGVAASPISSRFGAFLELMHTEENYVGILDAILQSPELLRHYAPFVSSFEDAKETLQQASERNPRFHAFLKVCKGKPECGRQELHELMIRPVQRLGSTLLLLREILKHTPEDSPDRKQLESALESLSHVLSFINEDKRKMEGLCRVFDVFNLIEKCPADVIASHRSLVVECEGVEVTEHGFGKQGNTLAFFIFTDVILVCKKKSKVVAMMKGQTGSSVPQRVLKVVRGKPYKFLQMLPLSTVRKVVDVANSETVSNTMGVVFRGKTEMRESCSYFRLPDSTDKAHLLERWTGALAAHNCVADPAKFLQRETAEEAGILSTTELLSKQINKAALMAVKTQVIVTSAFLGRTQSNASKSSCTSPPCVMSSFNSLSKLETMQERLQEDDEDEPTEKPKPSSLTATIMKRM
ncbi:protein ECT2-like isoform X2 [Thrips palmi]|uniref:Protein ECT2-like isoform X2 n=1 Tax=Thrips palmi TaxID=161013 RepID=A0A6P8ZH38_THRPL|nr:protein ECT2-like isoform X2 [Thrips palmi]